MKRDRHAAIVERKMRRSPRYRRAFLRTLHQIDLALLVREMRDSAKLTQQELAERAGTSSPSSHGWKMPNTPAIPSKCWDGSPPPVASR